MAETTHSEPLLRGMRPEAARRRIASFGKRFSEAHLHFARHAAFPLAVTPDLLYRLWGNFQQDINRKRLKIPWIAVADLLLSDLCEEVGHELYEMDVTVRATLLQDLKADRNFGDKRIRELSEFLLVYVKKQLDNSYSDFAITQRWLALAYTHSQEAARELAQALYESLRQNDKAEQMRLASLIETFAEPLAGFTPLLTYARGIGYWVCGDKEGAVTQFNKMGGREVQGVALPIPEAVRDQVDTQVCPKCGNVTRASAKFCDECGTPLSVQAESVIDELKRHIQQQDAIIAGLKEQTQQLGESLNAERRASAAAARASAAERRADAAEARASAAEQRADHLQREINRLRSGQ